MKAVSASALVARMKSSIVILWNKSEILSEKKFSKNIIIKKKSVEVHKGAVKMYKGKV